MRITQDDAVRQAAIRKAKDAARSKQIAASKVDEVAEDFEAVFLSQMLQHMFEGVETDPLTGGGQSEDMYRSLLVDEYGKLIAKSGGIGVADHVKREILKLQEVE